ncbi:MAG: hypothetical protein ACPGXY_03470 [Alphaproteobacteria bacterium]
MRFLSCLFVCAILCTTPESCASRSDDEDFVVVDGETLKRLPNKRPRTSVWGWAFGGPKELQPDKEYEIPKFTSACTVVIDNGVVTKMSTRKYIENYEPSKKSKEITLVNKANADKKKKYTYSYACWRVFRDLTWFTLPTVITYVVPGGAFTKSIVNKIVGGAITGGVYLDGLRKPRPRFVKYESKGVISKTLAGTVFYVVKGAHYASAFLVPGADTALIALDSVAKFLKRDASTIEDLAFIVVLENT